MDKFSIILPVRNGGNFIKDCVNSILSQTLQNFDLLILDNKSDDGTSEWLAAQKSNRIKIFSSDRPLTIEENWKRALDIPKNEFITLIGHDDLLDERYLEEMDKLIKENPDATLYQSHFRFINAEGVETGKSRKMQQSYDIGEYLEAILSDSIDTMGTGYMMRSKDYDKIGGIPSYPNLLYADHALWIRLTSLGYMAVSDRECFSYRVNQSVSKLTDASKYIDAFLLFLTFLVNLKTNNVRIREVVSSKASTYIYFYCRALSHRLLKTPVNRRNKKNVSEFIIECKKKAVELSVADRFKPTKDTGILLAKLIDGNFITRSLYLSFRRLYTKPIYS